MKIAVCIPTYNRANSLENCLKSLLHAKYTSNISFEICISDNGSIDSTEEVVQAAKKNLDINYHKNTSNLGYARNFTKVVSMAESEFIWLIGDDDLLMPDAVSRLINLINSNPKVDFFYVNSYLLDAKYFDDVNIPFSTEDLPVNMKSFSSYQNSGEIPFLELIDPKISFDFLGGMFLSVFRKNLWDIHVDCLNQEAIKDDDIFSHFDNTFPHLKIFAKAFNKSTAFYNKNPLIISLSGLREWAKLYPLVHSVRLIEALEEYRSNGLPYLMYFRCKNYALRNSIPHYVKILMDRSNPSYKNLNFKKIIINSIMYPNFYLSPIYFMMNRVLGYFKKLMRAFACEK